MKVYQIDGKNSATIESIHITDNLNPIRLEWDGEINDPVICGEMPLLRKNYKDLQLILMVYFNELEIEKEFERMEK